MKKQYVVFGVDRFGASVARTLEKAGCQVIAVDKDSEKIQAIADDVSYALTADVEDPETIKNMGLRNVDGAVITMVDNMEASIVSAMMCQEMGLKYIVARAKNKMHGQILEKIGVSKIVYPEQEMGERVGRFIAAQDFMDWVSLSPNFSLVEMMTPPEWAGKSLAELNLRNKYGFNIVGMKKEDQMQLQLQPNAPLEADTVLYVIGKNTDLEKFQN
ncbi:MAG: TrkA family potassium uptake protein [Lachnospiraceae bacterium]|nr:TrkA family potassium uptake protein [Lachnospiraceae bacterium]MDD3796487.1 TrkA family potassium uptake protein [Lachnospiraceae bacterium]